MFNSNNSEQKSPQQRFLFILGVTMIVIFFALVIAVAFFGDQMNLDPERFPQKYRIAFGVVLIVYAAIRFFRITKNNKW